MATTSKNNEKAQKTQLGYPLLEKLIETEDFAKVSASFSASYGVLESMLKEKGQGLKKQKGVRAALKAYDLTVDLIRELLKTKYSMATGNKGVVKK